MFFVDFSLLPVNILFFFIFLLDIILFKFGALLSLFNFKVENFLIFFFSLLREADLKLSIFNIYFIKYAFSFKIFIA